MTLPLDSGKDFIDQNGHRMEDFTLLPLIRAVQDLTDQGVTQQFDWPSVDFVTDRGRLRKLLLWAAGRSDQWKVDTQLAGANTVLLSGRPPVTKETSGRSTRCSFNFKEAATYPAPGLGEEPGHHRIIAYVRVLCLGFERIDHQRYQNFDGLRMVVRFEVDACLPYDTTTSKPPSNDATTDRTAMKKEPSSGSSSNPPDIRIIRAGSSQVPQTHLVEIHTRSNQYKNWPNSYIQLYIGQTPHLYYAFHKKGTFTSVEKFMLGQSELMDVDKTEQVGFKKLRKLLGYIKSLVLKYGAMRLSLVCAGKTLSVYRIPQGESCLPEDALALFVS